MRTSSGIALLAVVALFVACDGDTVRTHSRLISAKDCADVRPAIPAGECTDIREYMRTAGFLDTDGDAVGVAASAGLAFVADGDNDILIIDACDPGRMSLLSSVQTAGSARGIDVAHGYLFVASGEEGLVVVKVRDPADPVVVATVAGVGNSVDIVVAGDPLRAYMADDAIGLMIYDVRRPFDPKVLGVENTPGVATGVAVVGSIAYVSDERLGLRIVSVESPDSPWLVDAVGTPGDAQGVAVADRCVVVADGAAGLTVIDAAVPTSAKVVGRVATADRVTDVAAAGDIVYALDRTEGLLVYDVSVPETPVLVTKSGAEGSARAIALSRDYAYIADGFAGLRVVDVRTPAPAPVLVEVPTGPTHSVYANGQAVYATVLDNIYVTEWQGGDLVRRGVAALPGRGSRIVEYEGQLYVASDQGIMAVDVSNPERPLVSDLLPGSLGAVNLAIGDGIVFAAKGIQSPTMYDLRGQGPVVYLDVGINVVTGVAVGFSYAYLVSVKGKMWVVSLQRGLSNPIVWVQLTNGNSTDAHVRGDLLSGEHLYVANRSGFTHPQTGADIGAGVEVYDLSNAREPEFEYLIETSIPAEQIAFDGNLMYVIGGRDGLELMDISDPAAPVPVGSYWQENPVNGAASVDGAIILATDAFHLIAIPSVCDAP